MVTSRRRLIALDGAEPLSLDTLPPGEARELFTGLARRAPSGAEETAVADVIRLCGYLPLAIALLAGRLAHHPSWTITAFAADFAAAKDRLAELSAGDRAVAAAFELSYRNLPPGRRRLFRRLGMHPGHDYDAYAAAALDDIPLAQARRELEALYNDHLIGEPASGRYRFHDLIREYARGLASSRESTRGRSQAMTRLLDYYQHSAQVADEHLARHTRPGSPLATPAPSAAPELIDRASALTWMHAEQANLMGCLAYAAASGQPARIIALTAAMAAFLRQQGPWQVASAIHQTAAATARQIGDPLREVNALWELGSVHRLTGDFPAAAELLERSLALYRGIGDQRGEAGALRELGRVRRLMGDFSVAAGLMERALEIYRKTSNRLSEASALRQLGSVRRLTGDYPAAAGLLEQALAIYQDLGDQLGVAGALWELGSVHRLTGDFPVAAELLERSLALYQDTSSDLGEANSYSELGSVRRLTGDFPAAAQLLERSLALYRRIGDQHGEAGVLRELGCVRRLTGDFPAAAELLERSLARYRGTGDHLGAAETLNSMAALQAESAGSRAGLALYRQALDHARQVHAPLEEARALEGTARCEARAGNWAPALAALREAVAIYQAIGAAERNSAVSYLATLEDQARNDTPLSS
jgi:tetratricopeptide (TPR) repeat protein